MGRPMLISNPWPAAIAAALIVAIGWRVHTAEGELAPRDSAYLASVARSIDETPYKLGRWLGRDEPVAEAAVEILSPTRIVQRAFTDPRDPRSTFSLLIVHSAATRDMLGHYPPVCYPGQGWRQESVSDIRLSWNNAPMTGRRYEFAMGDSVARREMVVVNLIVLPSKTKPFAVTHDELISPSVVTSRAAEGVAQIQILLPGSTSTEDEQAIIEVVIDGVGRVIESVLAPTLSVDAGEVSR